MVAALTRSAISRAGNSLQNESKRLPHLEGRIAANRLVLDDFCEAGFFIYISKIISTT
jgi:hypothetical protein